LTLSGRFVKRFSPMTERIYVSRNAYLAAGLAAVLTFLALLWVGKSRDQDRAAADQSAAAPEKRAVAPSSASEPSTAEFASTSLATDDHWTPAPAECARQRAEAVSHRQTPAGQQARWRAAHDRLPGRQLRYPDSLHGTVEMS
jgi:hypothetical protein